jgi:hypothetical protein
MYFQVKPLGALEAGKDLGFRELIFFHLTTKI